MVLHFSDHPNRALDRLRRPLQARDTRLYEVVHSFRSNHRITAIPNTTTSRPNSALQNALGAARQRTRAHRYSCLAPLWPPTTSPPQTCTTSSPEPFGARLRRALNCLSGSGARELCSRSPPPPHRPQTTNRRPYLYWPHVSCSWRLLTASRLQACSSHRTGPARFDTTKELTP